MAFESDLEGEINAALGTGQHAAAPSDPFEAAAAAYKVPAKILRGMFQVESGGGKYLKSPAGAQGPMGLMPVLQKKYGVTDPNDLAQAVPAAAQYLREGLDKHGGDLGQALQYYHGGPNEKIWGPLTAQYPGQVYTASGHTGGGTFDSSDIDAGLQGLRPEQVPQAKATVSAGPQAPWGTGNSILNGATLGAEPYINAAISTARDLFHSDNKLSIPQNFQRELVAQKYGREAYNAEHPTGSVINELAGSTAASVPLLMAGGAGAETMTAGFGRAVPALEPAVSGLGRFLGGEAGSAAASRAAAPNLVGPTSPTSGIGGWLLRRASQGAQGAIQGAATAGLQSGLNARPEGSAVGVGAGEGAAINMAVSPVVSSIMRPFVSTLTPKVAALGQKLQGLGVNLPGWAMSGDKGLVALGKSVDPITEELHGDWTRALSRTAGGDTPVLDQQALSTMKDTVGQKLDKAAAGSDIWWDGKLHDAMTQAHSDVMDNPLAPDNVKNAVGKLQDRIDGTLMQHGGNKLGFQIPGSDYQALMAKNGPIGQLLASKDQYAQQAGRAYRDAFWDSLDRNFPGQSGEWTAAKTQYKNLKVLEDAAKKAGPNGVPNPQTLLTAVTQHYPNYATSGAGDIGALAEGGKFMPKLEPSGTVKGSSSAHGLPLNLNSLGGLAAATFLGGEAAEHAGSLTHMAAENPGAAISLAALLGGRTVAKHVAGKYVASPEFTNSLIQRSLSGSGPPQGATTLANILRTTPVVLGTGVENQ